MPPEAGARALSGPRTPPRLRIRSVATAIADVPIRRPHHFAALTIDHQSYVIVRVAVEDGLEGLGEGVTPGGPWAIFYWQKTPPAKVISAALWAASQGNRYLLPWSKQS